MCAVPPIFVLDLMICVVDDLKKCLYDQTKVTRFCQPSFKNDVIPMKEGQEFMVGSWWCRDRSTYARVIQPDSPNAVTKFLQLCLCPPVPVDVLEISMHSNAWTKTCVPIAVKVRDAVGPIGKVFG